jgi:hypothetical protein
MSQFPKVNCRFGAPMGRHESTVADPGEKVSLFRVNLDSGGYDDGGAYWGFGQPLYCARGTDSFLIFTRAICRYKAAKKMEAAVSEPIHWARRPRHPESILRSKLRRFAKGKGEEK